MEEEDIISPLLTVANSRHIGGGIEISPYSRFSDGLLDLVWLDHVPNVVECADAVARAYRGKILGCKVFGWKRVRDIEITRAQEGDEPPVLMADGEYVGRLPVKVVVQDRALRVLVPPAVVESQAANTEEKVLEVHVGHEREREAFGPFGLADLAPLVFERHEADAACVYMYSFKCSVCAATCLMTVSSMSGCSLIREIRPTMSV